jgi:hypothetical protein
VEDPETDEVEVDPALHDIMLDTPPDMFEVCAHIHSHVPLLTSGLLSIIVGNRFLNFFVLHLTMGGTDFLHVLACLGL